ncbi:MAG: hypothetical protein WC528_04195 [Patescibacteria group bacterium]
MSKKKNRGSLQKLGGTIGSRKHGKSGHVHNEQHFTGTKAGKRQRRNRRKSKKGSEAFSLTRKERHAKRRTHVNKYRTN